MCAYVEPGGCDVKSVWCMHVCASGASAYSFETESLPQPGAAQSVSPNNSPVSTPSPCRTGVTDAHVQLFVWVLGIELRSSQALSMAWQTLLNLLSHLPKPTHVIFVGRLEETELINT